MYRVVPASLDADKTLPPVHVYTRDGSRAAANEWWVRKLREVEGVSARVEKVRRIVAGDDDLSRKAREATAAVEERNRLLGQSLAGAVNPDAVQAVVDEGLRRLGEAPAPRIADAVVADALREVAPDWHAAIARTPEIDVVINVDEQRMSG